MLLIRQLWVNPYTHKLLSTHLKPRCHPQYHAKNISIPPSPPWPNLPSLPFKCTTHNLNAYTTIKPSSSTRRPKSSPRTPCASATRAPPPLTTTATLLKRQPCHLPSNTCEPPPASERIQLTISDHSRHQDHQPGPPLGISFTTASDAFVNELATEPKSSERFGQSHPSPGWVISNLHNFRPSLRRTEHVNPVASSVQAATSPYNRLLPSLASPPKNLQYEKTRCLLLPFMQRRSSYHLPA